MVEPANQQVGIAAFDMRKGLRSETGTIITLTFTEYLRYLSTGLTPLELMSK